MSCPDDYRPIALTSMVMKGLEKLIKTFITSTLQFAIHANTCVEDAAGLPLLHKTLSRVGSGKENYVKTLLVDSSSAFRSIVLSRLGSQLQDLGLDSSKRSLSSAS